LSIYIRIGVKKKPIKFLRHILYLAIQEISMMKKTKVKKGPVFASKQSQKIIEKIFINLKLLF